MSTDKSKLVDLAAAGLGSFFRPKDLGPLGISLTALRSQVREGRVRRLGRGLYRRTEADVTEHYTVAAVCARVPQAIVCLLSALQVHEIGTQLPREVWIAIGHKDRPPRVGELPIRLVRFSGPSLQYGVETIHLEGVPVRITSAARTVVDCFRFQRLVGRDVALEALREALHERKASVDQIWRAAEVCRARSLLVRYLEVLAG